MKKKVLITIGVILIVLLPIIIYFLVSSSSEKIANGKYYVVQCEEYPDAYAVVQDGTIRFHNIDLNKIYQKEQVDTYCKLNKLSSSSELSEEAVIMSDLNYIFSDNAYQLDEDKVIKKGTFEYWYPCNVNDSVFGLQIIYNSWDKTIRINNYQMAITFEK